jgi:hypothetical protein
MQLKQFNMQKATSAIEAAIAGTEAAVQAYKALAGIPVVGPALGAAAAGAVGIFTAAQVGFILSQQAPTFETGTLPSGYTVPDSSSSRGDSQTIRVNPGEHIDVTPRGEGGVSQRIMVQLDRQVLFDVVNKGIRSGEIRITAANLN